MSHAHDIDDDDQFFYFDPYDGPSPLRTPRTSFESHQHPIRLDHYFDMASHDDLPTSEERHDFGVMSDAMDKGKGVTKPLLIPPSSVVNDVFEMSPSTSFFASSSHDDFSFYALGSPSSHNVASMSVDSYDHHNADYYTSIEPSSAAGPSMTDSQNGGSGKGKQRESPPTLPPLSFSPTSLVSSHSNWLSSTPVSPPDSVSSEVANSPFDPSSATEGPRAPRASMSGFPEVPELRRMPYRRRSFSNVPMHPRFKVKLGPTRGTSGLARTLLFKRRNESPSDEPRDFMSVFNLDEVEVAHSSCLMPWRADIKPGASLDCIRGSGLDHSLVRPDTVVRPLKVKGRSHSAPLPFSALDIVSATSLDAFTPIPIIIRNYFDEILPRELRLRILSVLLTIHQEDHERALLSGHWSMARAASSRGQWIGRDKGLRELVKLSRVSRGWQTLVFDGELWQDLNLRAFPAFPVSLLLHVAQTGGTFIKTLNVSGHTALDSDTLLTFTNNLCLSSDPLPLTQLTTINLQGCTGLKTRSLHHLLVRSLHLQRLSLKGSPAVTNNTCNIIVTYCPQLLHLDISRCPNLDVDGIRNLASAVITRGDHLALQSLRLCGLKYVDDDMMAKLGRAAPHLEVLDLSYCRSLHNSSIEAFVSASNYDVITDHMLGVPTVMIAGRDMGRADDMSKYRRRVTRLRHLSLSSCILLTDVACSNLAHSVPNLEFLELAGIGADLHDDGLIRLLETTPNIRRLDLEDATEITDDLIEAITPYEHGEDTDDEDMEEADGIQDVIMSDPHLDPQPGHALEYLNIAHASQVSDDSLIRLIHRCSKLKALEADDTRISSKVLREFVKWARQRKMVDARINAVDCRGISEGVVKELAANTRPRKGFRRYDARRLRYVDERDGYLEEIKDAQDECDETRVVLKSFYSWQAVDAIKTEREKRKKANVSAARRLLNASNGSITDVDGEGGRDASIGRLGRARWWSPTGRSIGTRSAGAATPAMRDFQVNNNDGCTIM